jgi:hypothetical protein
MHPGAFRISLGGGNHPARSEDQLARNLIGKRRSEYQSATADIASLHAEMVACEKPWDAPLPADISTPEEASGQLATAYDLYVAERQKHASVSEEAKALCPSSTTNTVPASTPTSNSPSPSGNHPAVSAGATIIGSPYDPAPISDQPPQTTDDIDPVLTKGQWALTGVAGLAILGLAIWSLKRKRKRSR